MTASLRLGVLALLVVGCRPQQAELDEINRKLDQLSAQQEQLIANLDTQWAAERRSEPTQQQRRAPDDNWVEVAETLDRLQDDMRTLLLKVDDLEKRGVAKPAAAPRPGRPDPAERYRVDVGKAQVKGRNDALVTVVMFTDYQCPFCKRVQPTIGKVKQAYGKDVRIVLKHNALPMHNRAEAAALAAEAAGRQGKFWEMHDKLYQDPRALTDENFERYADELGLDIRRFNRDRKDKKLLDRIKADQTQANKIGARGTPAFFINGRFLSGAQPYKAFEVLVDEELAHARKMVKKGTKRRSVYKTLMKSARPEV